MLTIDHSKPDRHSPPSNAPMVWYDLENFEIEGRGFDDAAMPYNRLPARAEQIVRPEVWTLSTHSAGLSVRFITDATRLSARWTLCHGELSTSHMSSTAASGIDLYVKLHGEWRWQAVAGPQRVRDNETPLVGEASPMLPGKREFQLYLPLYNGVRRVEIGIPRGAMIGPAPAAARKPICCYGTSIVQGDCVSRSGMAYPAMLGRCFDRSTINLGFSGQGRAEPELAQLIAEIDAAVYVIDALPNLVHELVESRIPGFVRTLRRVHPRTPIVLVESIRYPDGQLVPERLARASMSNAALRRVYRDLKSQGLGSLHYVTSECLLGVDGDATVDGTHPTDLGHSRIAQAIRNVLDPLLSSSRSQGCRA